MFCETPKKHIPLQEDVLFLRNPPFLQDALGVKKLDL